VHTYLKEGGEGQEGEGEMVLGIGKRGGLVNSANGEGKGNIKLHRG